jgi:hypothetical protein
MNILACLDIEHILFGGRRCRSDFYSSCGFR